MKVIYNKNVANAVITSSTENPLYLFDTALKDSRLSRYGKTLITSASWLKFTYSADIDVDVIGIFGSNLTENATVSIQANATDVWTSPSVNEELTFSKDVKASIDANQSIGVWSKQFDTTQTYKYWRIVFVDSTNTDNYIKVGRVFMDEALVMPGMSVNQVFKIDTNSVQTYSTSGQVYGLKRLQYNGVSFNFPSVEDSDKKDIEEFYYKTDIITPYMMMVWEKSLSIQKPLYVVNISMPEFTRVEMQSSLIWTFDSEIREVF